MARRTVWIGDELWARVTDAAHERRQSAAELVRDALEAWLGGAGDREASGRGPSPRVITPPSQPAAKPEPPKTGTRAAKVMPEGLSRVEQMRWLRENAQ